MIGFAGDAGHHRCVYPRSGGGQALQAGADLLLMPNGLADAYTAVLEAVQDGTIPQQRLDESVQRICSANTNTAS